MTGTTSPVWTLERVAQHLAHSAVESGLGIEPTLVRPGWLSARLHLGARTRTADGRVQPYALATLADTGVGMAVLTVPDAVSGPTIELSILWGVEPRPFARFLTIDAEAVTTNSATGVARAEIRDDTGALVAHATGILAVVPGRTAPDEKRPVTLFDAGAMQFEVLSEDGVHARIPVTPSMANNRGIVHGAVLAGITVAARTVLLGGPARVRDVSQTVTFLRPVPIDISHVGCRSTFVRDGRRFQTVRTELSRPDGTVVAEATGIVARLDS